MCMFKLKGDVARLSPGAFGLAIGLVKGLWLLGLAWAGWLGGYGLPMIQMIEKYHHSYTASLSGGIYGGVSGFICGFIFGFFVALIYNLCLRCCKKSSEIS